MNTVYSRIHLVKGDITRMRVDAIVNAANAQLIPGGGVDGAIHKAAGPELFKELKGKYKGCAPGKAVITDGYRLPAKYVIHTVGPVWQDGHHGEGEVLASAYRSSMELALQHDVKSIAFPNIGTGVYRFPKTRAAQIAIETVKNFLRETDADMEVYFVCFDEDNYQIYHQLLHPFNPN